MPNGTEQLIKLRHLNSFGINETAVEERSDYLTSALEFKEQNQKLLENQRTLMGRKKEDSREMQEIKLSLTSLSNKLHETSIAIRPEEFAVQLDEITKSYNQLIQTCTHYVSTKNPFTSSGKARLAMVNRVMIQAQKECNSLKGSAYSLFETVQKAGDNTVSWINVLGEMRSHHIDITNMDTEDVGNGSSHVWKFRQGTESVYFKPLETRPSDDSVTLLKNWLGQYTEQPDTKPIFEMLCKIPSSRATEAVNYFGLLLSSCQQNELNIADLMSDNTDQKNAANEKMALINQLLIDMGPGSITKNAFIHTPEGFSALYHIAKDVSKAATLSEISRVAHIKEGAPVSTRNVATSRVAGLLGVSDLFAKSCTVAVKNGKTETKGNLMLEAHGTSFYVIGTDATKNKIPTAYTPDMLRQLTILQIMDNLCAQYDRNDSNYLVQYQEHQGRRILTGLTAIDNDIAFGTLNFENIKNSSLSMGSFRSLLSSPNSDTCSLPAIDKEFYDSFMNLTPGILQFALCDLLSEDELNALYDRLHGIKSILTANAEANPNFLVEKDGWNDAARLFDNAALNNTYISKF